MTLQALSVVPSDDSVAHADSPVPAGARHRAPEPSSGTARDDTIVILPGWAAYGRHAAPASESSIATPLPALPVRPRNAPPATRPGVDWPFAGASRDAAPEHASARCAPLEAHEADDLEPDTTPATSGGILGRCLGPWKRSTGPGGPR